ncbi:TAXI family TRAP transporter solute-binding subunit [Paenibacillus agricola]|uniref:Uncharacterized protein n=1 Tax=Paenibacillus agricola TaxID=2716264 RepID=A0ABX0IZS0_9BACL|nr:TAXI family TRAP transporter solute-binding subunit [Paenibacillus agricola]NHN29061.1 hypothetical protein [Paenibacillus agricola]
MIDEEVGSKFLEDWFQKIMSHKIVRLALIIVLVGVVTGILGYSIYSVIPKSYELSISGGDILSSRHYFAKKLQEEAESNRLKLLIQPANGSLEILEQVNEGKLDVAFIQGGLDKKFPNVNHVATLVPEMLHVLVRGDLVEDDLKGTVIDLGPRDEGTRIIGKKVLDYMGLTEGVSYVETNNSAEDLISMPANRLPDVIFNISLTPSYIADYFVKDRGYKLMELPFPNSLALRQGWVANAEILAFTYNVDPPVPAKDIQTVGTNLQVVANSEADPKAISKMLEILYSPAMVGKTRQNLKEENILIAASFPVSAGTELFMARKDPIFSQEDFEKIQGIVGIGITVLSTLLIAFRKKKGKEQDTDDAEFISLFKELAAIETELNQLDAKGDFQARRLEDIVSRLNQHKQWVLEHYATSVLKDAGIVDRLLFSINDSRSYALLRIQKIRGHAS